jgi:hypothetical protein
MGTFATHQTSTSGDEIPKDPQVVGFRAAGATTLAETVDRGRRRNLGPAIVRRDFGSGQLIYIGSSLEAVYEETRMKVLRQYFDSLLGPWLAERRSYQLTFVSGVTPHLMASRDAILLHLLADTGNKSKHLRVREEFLPVVDVKVRVRIPQGRTVRFVSLLRSGEKLATHPRDGWLDLTIPRVLIHEALRVDLA